jgi:phosphatidylserine/phosphatidylglycerophosphate/cardiolipin synthase-like enzyme
MADFWVSGIVAKRDGLPYIQLSNEKGMIAQLSMSQTRQIAMDMLAMAARTEADAMIHRFFQKEEFPPEASVAVMVEFRDFMPSRADLLEMAQWSERIGKQRPRAERAGR